MINKEDICVIISSYPQTHLDSTLLSLTHESFSRQGYDICLVSHSPVNNDIQKASKYYIYSDENHPLNFPEPSSITIFFASEDLYYQTNWSNKMGSHSLSILMNLKNALYLLKNKKYKNFLFVDSDTFLNKEDHNILESKLEEISFLEKDYWFMIENSENMIVPVTSFFGGNIEYFHNVLENINNEEDYFNLCRPSNAYTLEALFSILFCINPTEKGYLDYNKPRDIFSSNWLGISTFGNADIPELEKKFNIDIDIVKDKNSEDHVFFILFFTPKQEPIQLRFYRDNIFISEYELTTGALHYWVFNIEETKNWKIEVFHNEKLINSLERTTAEILWNKWSFFENKMGNLEN